VGRYAEQHPGWDFARPLGSPLLSWEELRAVEADALIAPLRTARQVAGALRRFRHCVNYSGVLAGNHPPAVISDDRLVGEAAAAHFIGLGLPHVAVLVDSGAMYAARREAGFREALPGDVRFVGRFGRPALLAVPGDWPKLRRPLAAWIRGLPKPVGLFATHNRLALAALSVCEGSGVAVPDEVAVLGVESDPNLAPFLKTPLSYVPLNGERVGFECAALLGRLLSGEQPPANVRRIEPLPVVAARSTDYRKVDDPVIVRVLARIEEDLAAFRSVEDLGRGIPLSRRAFELRFRAVTGRSPYVELQLRKLDRAKRLLATTPLPIAEIAARCGFSEPRHLSVVFRAKLGQSPTAFRQRHRSAGSPLKESM